MREIVKPAAGSWTGQYPELGTDLVSYQDSISPEFYELEGEAIFKRAWLNVGRVEQLPRRGSFFTRDIAVAKASVINSPRPRSCSPPGSRGGLVGGTDLPPEPSSLTLTVCSGGRGGRA